jgi:hypothetical protein
MNLYQRSGRVWEPLDSGPVDVTHPIPNLEVIDIHATKKGGGADLVVIVASPLRADARSMFRLARKLDAYLQEITGICPFKWQLRAVVPTPGKDPGGRAWQRPVTY